MHDGLKSNEKTKTCVFQFFNSIHAKSTEDETSMTDERKMKVWLRMVFLKIEEIDTVKEQFRSDIFLQARWREPTLDGLSLKNVDVEKYWNPNLHFENSKNSPTLSKHLGVELDDEQRAFITEKRRIHGDFSENLELQEFPFDVQNLSVLVSSDHPESEVELLEDPDEASSLNTHSFAQAQVWKLMDFVEVEIRSIDNRFSMDSNKHAGIFFRCCARRRSGFFVWNNFLLMGLITAMSFTIFAVDRNDPGRRLQLTFILVLTGITFKFVVTKSLPKISYLTHLDKYIISSMIFLFVVCVWHGVVPLFAYDVALSIQLDRWFFLVFVVVFIFSQIVFIVVIVGRGYKRRKASHRKLLTYRKKVNDIKYKRKVKKKLLARNKGWKALAVIRPS